MFAIGVERQEVCIHPMIDRRVLAIQKQAVLVVSRSLWRIAKVGDVLAVRAEAIFCVDRQICRSEARCCLWHSVHYQTSAISGV